MDAKPKVIKPLLALLVITFWLGLSIAGLVIGDIQSGVLSGEPETGWGILLAIYLMGPPFLIFSLFTVLSVKKARKAGNNIRPTLKLAGIITIVLVVVSGLYNFGMSKL